VIGRCGLLTKSLRSLMKTSHRYPTLLLLLSALFDRERHGCRAPQIGGSAGQQTPRKRGRGRDEFRRQPRVSAARQQRWQRWLAGSGDERSQPGGRRCGRAAPARAGRAGPSAARLRGRLGGAGNCVTAAASCAKTSRAASWISKMVDHETDGFGGRRGGQQRGRTPAAIRCTSKCCPALRAPRKLQTQSRSRRSRTPSTRAPSSIFRPICRLQTTAAFIWRTCSRPATTISVVVEAGLASAGNKQYLGYSEYYGAGPNSHNHGPTFTEFGPRSDLQVTPLSGSVSS